MNTPAPMPMSPARRVLVISQAKTQTCTCLQRVIVSPVPTLPYPTPLCGPRSATRLPNEQPNTDTARDP